MGKIRVGILGITGTVGQRFAQLLANHPQFEVVAVGASARSAGKTNAFTGLTILECRADAFKAVGVALVFSALDSSVAGEIEAAFADTGIHVLSNARNFRMHDDVPLVVPTVNTAHLDSLKGFSARNPGKGFIVTNANCSSTGLVVPLKALLDRFGPISQLHVFTQQAISGAGYPGVPSLDITENVVPFISGEEEKMETEPLKILGPGLKDGKFAFDEDMTISATCTRVPVIDGHTIHVSLLFASQNKPSPADVADALRTYTCEAQTLGCPSAPRRAIIVHEEENRPQPRVDRDAERGFAVSVGRVRACRLLDVKFTLLVHNTVLGAAGSSVLNAEVCVAKGLL
ncbi:aspartate-semialdehyde dehydrogenase [Chytriomyces sp. MP71]|nr:aspartate-semialdehyde dehydrogenase [Chytriomyces sp. MP71]